MSQGYQNFSEQEQFVLNLLDNKKNGHYVELGAAHSKMEVTPIGLKMSLTGMVFLLK